MRIKDILNYGLFLSITFGTFFFCVDNNLESQHYVLFVSTGLYFTIFLVKACICFKQGRRIEFWLNLFIAVVLFQISLKSYYTYYNRYFAYAIIFAAMIYQLVIETEKLSVKVVNTRRWLTFILIVAIITISIPDKAFLFYTTKGIKPWTPNIKWTDFRARKYDPSDNIAVYINSGLQWKHNKAFDYPPAVVVSQMHPNNSIINDYWEVREDDVQLLMHEQGHFNSKESSARQVMDSLRNHWIINESEIDRIVYIFFERMKKTDSLYDEETLHGRDSSLQKKWTQRFLKELKLE